MHWPCGPMAASDVILIGDQGETQNWRIVDQPDGRVIPLKNS